MPTQYRQVELNLGMPAGQRLMGAVDAEAITSDGSVTFLAGAIAACGWPRASPICASGMLSRAHDVLTGVGMWHQEREPSSEHDGP